MGLFLDTKNISVIPITYNRNLNEEQYYELAKHLACKSMNGLLE